MIIRPIVCRRFIGRTDELAYLHERRREAGLSHGGLVLVTGEAGVGKTRLLSEFGSSLAKSRWRVGIGPCLEFAQRPYGPVALAGDGNPFFTEELLKSAVEQGPVDGGAFGRQLPSTLRATLMERLRPLGDDERTVIAQAAVIGRSFDVPLLAATLHRDQARVVAALRRVRRLQLIEEDSAGEFRFRHALTRDAIYGEFLNAQLQPMHRNIAVALEVPPADRRAVPSLAYHWRAAGDAERTVHYNELAGDAAGLVYAHTDAIGFYQHALAAAGDHLHRRATLLEKIGEHRQALGNNRDAFAEYVEAAETFRAAGDGVREAACRVQSALQAWTLGDREPAAGLAAMLDRTPHDLTLLRSRLQVGIAWFHAFAYCPEKARQHLALVDAAVFEADPTTEMRYWHAYASSLAQLGDVDGFRRAHAAWATAAERAGGTALVQMHCNAALGYSVLGRHEEAVVTLRRTIETARAQRDRLYEAVAHAIAAYTYVVTGELENARASISAAAAIPTESEPAIAHATAWGTLAGAHLGDDGLIDAWFDRRERTISSFGKVIYAAGYAEILVHRGRLDEAQAMLHDAIEFGERPRGNMLTLLAVARYGLDEDVERARVTLARAADAPSEVVEQHAIHLFDALVARRRGRRDEAASSAAAALEGLRRMRFRLLEAAALELTGERDAARVVYRACGAAYDVKRLQRAPGAEQPLSARAADRPAQRSQPDQLSAREREIARLTAGGRSNIEVGRELSISHKTVEKYLGSIYKKARNFEPRAVGRLRFGDRRSVVITFASEALRRLTGRASVPSGAGGRSVTVTAIRGRRWRDSRGAVPALDPVLE